MDKFQLDFLGIGTIKSGTSMLADLMMQHPDIQWASRKEVSYFNALQADGSPNPYYTQPFSFYRQFFPDSVPGEMKQGEFSPVYMADAKAMNKIKSLFPDIRLIITLRNPVDRAYSHFLYAQNFLQSIPKEYTFEQSLERYPYLKDLGMYSDQIQRVFSLLPPSQCLILIFEEMIQNPVKAVREVYRHIGVDDSFIPRVTKVNTNKTIRYQWLENTINYISQLKTQSPDNLLNRFYNSPIYPVLLKWKHRIRDVNVSSNQKLVLEPDTYDRLYSEYVIDIKKTEELLGRDKPLWR